MHVLHKYTVGVPKRKIIQHSYVIAVMSILQLMVCNRSRDIQMTKTCNEFVYVTDFLRRCELYMRIAALKYESLIKIIMELIWFFRLIELSDCFRRVYT